MDPLSFMVKLAIYMTEWSDTLFASSDFHLEPGLNDTKVFLIMLKKSKSGS